MLLLLLLWISAVNSAAVLGDHPEACNIRRRPITGLLDYECEITLENMETVSTAIKQPHIEVLLISIGIKLENFAFDDNGFSPDLKYFAITSGFPFYMPSEAFNSSTKLMYFAVYVIEARDLEATTTIKKNVNWTSPAFSLGWLAPITGLRTLILSHGYFSSFRPGEFCVLQQLQMLDLSKNIIQSSEEFGIMCNRLDTSCIPCLPNVTNLNISYNPLKTLNLNIADNLPQLRNLGISHCMLSHVNLSLLVSSTLERLEINNNMLRSLVMECQHFRNKSHLTVLLLQDNQLQTLSAGLFSCIQQLQHLDLSKSLLNEDTLNLAHLNVLTNLTWLDLSFNKIGSLSSTLIGNLTELVEFSCTGCRLMSITNDSITQLRKLRVLRLDKNSLHVIESGALSHLNNLQILDLSHNYLSDTTFIRTFPSLKKLLLGHNNLPDIPDFSGSSWILSTLILDRNNISKVDDQHLCGLLKLRKLSLPFNHIQHVQDYAFENLPILKELILNDNIIKIIEYNGLDRISNLTHLRLDSNLLTMFPPLNPINLPFVQVLNLNKNLIQNFKFREPHYSLEVIDLSQNHISKMTVDTRLFISLRILHLEFNNIQSLEKKYLQTIGTPRPKVLLRGNPLHCDCHIEWLLDTKLNMTIDQVTSLKGRRVAKFSSQLNDIGGIHLRASRYLQIADLDLIECGNLANNGGKSLSTLTHGDFHCTYDNICIKSSCQHDCCQHKNCSCRSFCYRECNCYHTNDNSINNMNCTSRHMTALSPQGPTYLKSMNLDGNNLSFLNLSALNFPYLEMLYLNKSHVSHLEGGVFSHLTHLRILDLHQNEIENIRTDTFSNIRRLEELYIQENKIKFIESDSFSDTSGLTVLFLHKNKFKNVNLTIFDELDSLNELTLHDNPWVCDCQFGPVFQKWLMLNSKVISKPTEIYCLNYIQLKGKSLEDASFHNDSINTLFQPVLNIDLSICRNLTGPTHIEYRHSKSVVGGISIVAAFAVLVVVLFVIHKNRLLLRVWMYNTYGLCFHTEDNEKPYDVFIAYSKADDILVAHGLLPELEQGQMSYKVCIEGRDFPVGPPTADMIIAAIQKSKRTILLVSHNYFNTQWCEYSFDAGLYQVLSDKQIRLLIILTDNDLQSHMTPSMKLYLKMNPFLVIGEKWFWRKLQYYLPHNPQGADVVMGRQFNLMEVY